MPEKGPCPISSKLFMRGCKIRTLLPHFYRSVNLARMSHTGLTQSFEQCICDFVGIWLRGLSWCHRQAAYDFPLAPARNFAIALKSRQNFLVSEILTPCLELFGVLQTSWPSWTRVFLKLCGLKYNKKSLDFSVPYGLHLIVSDVELVEAAGVEPASESIPPKLLHAYSALLISLRGTPADGISPKPAH